MKRLNLASVLRNAVAAAISTAYSLPAEASFFFFFCNGLVLRVRLTE